MDLLDLVFIAVIGLVALVALAALFLPPAKRQQVWRQLGRKLIGL
jgi:hypothetical protein